MPISRASVSACGDIQWLGSAWLRTHAASLSNEPSVGHCDHRLCGDAEAPLQEPHAGRNGAVSRPRPDPSSQRPWSAPSGSSRSPRRKKKRNAIAYRHTICCALSATGRCIAPGNKRHSRSTRVGERVLDRYPGPYPGLRSARMSPVDGASCQGRYAPRPRHRRSPGHGLCRAPLNDRAAPG